MNLRRRTAAVLIAAAVGSATMPLAAVSATSGHHHHKKAHNANFKGTWSATTGGWVITKEKKSTGACKGTSDFAGYSLTHCKVKGHKYKFSIVFGSYVSKNKGKFHGNKLHGSFTDSNGTTEAYTGVRS